MAAKSLNLGNRAQELAHLPYAIEFQRRGLPHAHIIIKLHPNVVSPKDTERFFLKVM